MKSMFGYNVSPQKIAGKGIKLLSLRRENNRENNVLESL